MVYMKMALSLCQKLTIFPPKIDIFHKRMIISDM